MKVLIFSISAGGGHSKAAESLKEYIDLYSSKSTVKVIDTLKYINPIIDKVIIGSYLKTIKITPSLFGKLYDYTESDYGLSIISAKFNEIMTYRLLPLIKDFNPDILIATHPFPTEMLSILKSKHKINRPIISILTDYAPHSFWLHPCIDAYIVSNKYMISEMVSKGIPKNTIYPFGIPVSRDFLTNYSREETLSEINFYSDKPTILVMGGSLGIGKITKVYENLLKINEDIQIIVIAGNNKKLYYELLSYRHSLDKDSTSYIIGFTDKVNKYMQASDLLLTKPGGLTITEALVSSIPLALFSPIPGQEEKNAEFLLTNNLAVDLGDGSNTKDIIENLLKDKSKLSNIKENQRKFSKPDVGKNIYNLILKLISDYKINIEEIYLNEKNPD
ncbi:UDP-glucuronosyltransferase [Clostridium tetani]|uniref:1,2-diacylglycerol 3-glucosyltransferase n=1 Tax=Clostridium tetani (strain Massachusetts / E88) TaxID=212717 RepID=Q898Z7_CLOTE|nr:glycosyltransferase [Clostridium tetani]AAO34932.1 1,2-diacylglycerol 3-glucosyltransferase [Clostridium tetani E88]AVP55567.1 UDP-N-acetylglucosamine--LPS N-acetylglucosamine transferase [Clostridium tetani]KGI37312.1 UDP-glucuronosyltransferase [Clostridium tetani ATCC 9441]KGI40718.1 UDP-glucuronosyltransferase [Clostridium tetani]KGI42174.1 UDP-glucuronosyltransferase [Clostridium tetani]